MSPHEAVFLLQWGTPTSDLMSPHEAELTETNLFHLSSLTWLQMRNRFFCLWPVHCDTHMRYAQWKNGSHVLALMKVTLLTGLVWAPWYYKRNRLTFNHACSFFKMMVFQVFVVCAEAKGVGVGGLGHDNSMLLIQYQNNMVFKPSLQYGLFLVTKDR